jgi:hypothetical protein
MNAALTCYRKEAAILQLKTTHIIIILFFCLLLITPLSCRKADPPVILYIPLDNRPVNYDFVHSLNNLTPITLLTPPKELLNNGETETDPTPLWDWLQQNISSADVLVLSLDTLFYGGLVPSRNHNIAPDILTTRLESLKTLAASTNARILAFSTVMRSEFSSHSFGHPEYFTLYGDLLHRLSSFEDKADRGTASEEELAALASLRERIPSEFLLDYLERRRLNHDMLASTLELVNDDAISFLALGRDDTSPFSHSQLERRHLTPLLEEIGPRVATFPGADEIGMLLYTRAVNIINNHTPRVHVSYATPDGGSLIPLYEDIPLDQSLHYRLLTLGALESPSADSDFLLFINTPAENFSEAVTQSELEQPSPLHKKLSADIASAIASGRPAALADIAYCNGADAALMRHLAKEMLLPSLAAYAGWNTAGNSIGTALAHGVLYSYYHSQPGFDPEVHLTSLKLRLLEDWGYQAGVRAKVQETLELAHGGTPIPPEKINLAILTIKEGLADFSGEYMYDGFGSTTQIRSVALPWNRLFDLHLEILPDKKPS